MGKSLTERFEEQKKMWEDEKKQRQRLEQEEKDHTDKWDSDALEKFQTVILSKMESLRQEFIRNGCPVPHVSTTPGKKSHEVNSIYMAVEGNKLKDLVRISVSADPVHEKIHFESQCGNNHKMEDLDLEEITDDKIVDVIWEIFEKVQQKMTVRFRDTNS
jgi:hypothetical protein